MDSAPAEQPDTPITATEQRRQQESRNKLVALLLAGIGLLFLCGALGVAALVLYGPY